MPIQRESDTEPDDTDSIMDLHVVLPPDDTDSIMDLPVVLPKPQTSQAKLDHLARARARKAEKAQQKADKWLKWLNYGKSLCENYIPEKSSEI